MYNPRILLLIIVLHSSLIGTSQVYNFTPASYYNFETNPSIIASARFNNRLRTINHIGRNGSSFLYNSLRFSKFSESRFYGLGISINNTSLGYGSNYQHVAIATGYSNVLFNTLYVRLGAAYKLINSNSQVAGFDYYEVTKSENDVNNVNQNLNLSFSIASNDFFYVSISTLNIDLPWLNTLENYSFPSYFVINAGNLLTPLNGLKQELTYSFVAKYVKGAKGSLYSHYLDYKRGLANITRRCSLRCGIRAGYANGDHYQITPNITYFRKNLVINLYYNVHLEDDDFISKYDPTIQLSLIYNKL